jgi:hypothetical protein
VLYCSGLYCLGHCFSCLCRSCFYCLGLYCPCLCSSCHCCKSCITRFWPYDRFNFNFKSPIMNYDTCCSFVAHFTQLISSRRNKLTQKVIYSAGRYRYGQTAWHVSDHCGSVGHALLKTLSQFSVLDSNSSRAVKLLAWVTWTLCLCSKTLFRGRGVLYFYSSNSLLEVMGVFMTSIKAINFLEFWRHTHAKLFVHYTRARARAHTHTHTHTNNFLILISPIIKFVYCLV